MALRPVLIWDRESRLHCQQADEDIAGVQVRGGTLSSGVHATHRCSRLHGHSYRVEDPAQGTGRSVVDFFDLGKSFAGIMAALDHRCLSEVAGLENPTAENIAVWIWNDRLKSAIKPISAVRVYETTDCWAEFYGR